jgi:predicted RNA-binding Zn-ribbon protein involved in translation (DUF1610 family)
MAKTNGKGRKSIKRITLPCCGHEIAISTSTVETSCPNCAARISGRHAKHAHDNKDHPWLAIAPKKKPSEWEMLPEVAEEMKGIQQQAKQKTQSTAA